MKDHKFTEQELVDSLRSNDSKKFEALYDHFSYSIYGTICSLLPDQAQAQDIILVNTFLNAWNNSASYKPEESRLFTWLLGIAKKEAAGFIQVKEKLNEELFVQTELLFKQTTACQAVRHRDLL